MDEREALRHYFGHDSFRPGQETLVRALLSGRDALGIMPTGAGKSVCYQVPALLLPGITLVISPLISLMKDQVAALKEAGVAAAYLNSSLTPRQMDLAMQRAAQGQYKIIYVAPERLEAPSFRRFASQAPISLLAVDEAHCVSQWGQDFRPNYLRIADFIASLPARPPVGAFTATATQRVKDDIVRLLALRSPEQVTTGFDRPDLYFEVCQPKSKYEALRAILRKQRGRCGIVYCATRKAVEEVTDKLLAEGFSAARYHAGLSDEERRRSQEDFQYDRVALMVATNAFGMGIDKSNVNFVIHYNMPRSMEAYYQEAGRAGRDGSGAECILLYSGQDIITGRWLLEHSEPNPELTPQEQARVRQLDEKRLRDMADFCTKSTCLRASILRYFGQDAPESCGCCSRCTGGRYSEVNGLEREKRTAAEKRRLEAMPRAGQSLLQSPEEPAPDSLFEQLRNVRLTLSREHHVPSYIICADRTLTDMMIVRPRTVAEVTSVYGMGSVKASKYGEAFIRGIAEWEARHPDQARPASASPAPAAPAEPSGTPVRSYAVWTPEESARLKRGFEAGVTVAQLAAMHQRTEKAIGKQLRHLGLLSEGDEPMQAPKKSKGDASWSKEESEALRRGYLNGDEIPELARKHGRTEAAIRGRLRQLGLLFDGSLVERYGVAAWEPEEDDE